MSSKDDARSNGGARTSAATSTPGRRASTGSALADASTGSLCKRRDFLGDGDALANPSRTYFFKKTFDVEEIIESSTRRLSIDPHDVSSLFQRGLASFKKGDHSAAVLDLQSLLSKDAQHIEGLYTRGLAYSRLCKDELAIEDFSEVLRLDPDHVNAAFARAASYNSIGQFLRAIEAYNFALLKDTSSSSAPSRGGG